MRSLLFVPADSERKQEKALGSGADVLILDLEDSVAGSRKPVAREMAARFIAARHDGPRLYVRVNGLSSGLTDGDLAAVMPARPDGVMLPKANGAGDVMRLAAKLRVHEAENGFDDGETRILPIITETARGVLSAASYARALPRLCGVTWGAEDLSASVGASAYRDAEGCYTDLFRLARSVTLLAAAASETAAVDTVFPDFRDEAGLARDCTEAARDGFTAKMAIHPAQVPIINTAFTPSQEAVENARAIVAAFAEAGNPGVLSLGGRMYDRPHLRLAERLLARAGAGRQIA